MKWVSEDQLWVEEEHDIRVGSAGASRVVADVVVYLHPEQQ